MPKQDIEEETLDCLMSVDETLSEVEEALERKNYSIALNKLQVARSLISELRIDDEQDRQDIDEDVALHIK